MDLAGWLARDVSEWVEMVEDGVAPPSGREVADALAPWLRGGGGDGEVVAQILGLYEQAHPERRWLAHLMWLFRDALDDVTRFERSEACRGRPDFLERRSRLACTLVGAATILARQRVDVDLAERFGGVAEALARMFIETGPPTGRGDGRRQT